MSSSESTSRPTDLGSTDQSQGPLVSQLFDEARAHERRRRLLRILGAAILIVVLAVSLTLFFTKSTPSNGLTLATPQQEQSLSFVVRSILSERPNAAKDSLLEWARTNGIQITVTINETTNHGAMYTQDGTVGALGSYPPPPYLATQFTLNVVEHGQDGCQFRAAKHLAACAGAKFPY